MNGIKYLLDTNIILGIVAGNSDAGIKLKGINLENCAFSSVTRMKLPDAIILATALSHQIELLTLDKKLANKLQLNHG